MKIIIIEDEKPAARLLQRKVEKLGYTVNQMLHSVEEALIWFQNNQQPDLIFLDIQLSDGLSFEIFEKVNISSAIIFTTAYDEYALRAFKLNSIDYLLKPIDEDDLELAIAKFKKHFQSNNIATFDFEAIKRLLVNPIEKEYKTRYSVKIGNQIKIIPTENAVCFYSENKGTYLYSNEKREYLLDVSLENIEAELNPNDFFRINRKYVIALKAIEEIQLYSNSRLKLILKNFTSEEIIVARERVSDFKAWIN